MPNFESRTVKLQNDGARPPSEPNATLSQSDVEKQIRSIIKDCSVTLRPQFIPGGTVWTRQGPDHGEASILVIVQDLPDPRTFGEELTDYWYIIEDVREHRLSRLENTLIWFAYFSGTDIIVPFPCDALVSIVAGTREGPADEALPVLEANLRNCH